MFQRDMGSCPFRCIYDYSFGATVHSSDQRYVCHETHHRDRGQRSLPGIIYNVYSIATLSLVCQTRFNVHEIIHTINYRIFM